MGCEGFIQDINKEIKVEITCYICSEIININDINDLKKHKECTDINEQLPVNIYITNYIGR